MIPSCDIILLSWNNLELVKKCIESIFAHTEVPAHLLIIDNASDQKTQSYLKSLKSTDLVKVTIDLNPVNEGYSKGMNRGLKQSHAPYVCLLNNDTEVSPRWLSTIIEIFEKNPQIGVMNPNSNIFRHKRDGHLSPQSLSFKEMGLCVGFCMFIRREVIDKIGHLDEINYDRFFFEDSDYCKRAKEAGFLCALASESYVYHAEHQSVNKLRTKEEIFKKNQKTFYQKWGKPKRILVTLASEEWDSQKEALFLPMARRDHAIHILCKASQKIETSHTQLHVQSYSSFLPFKWYILLKLLLKRKKPYDFIYVPQTSLSCFLKKWQLLYRKPLLTTWEEVTHYAV